MTKSARQAAAATPRDPAELRLLIESSALRKLADRGLSDEELAMTRQLADATMGPALNDDVPAYLRADMMFHLYLLELTGDPALPEVARLLLALGLEDDGPRGVELDMRMAVAAREHSEIVSLLADDMVHEAVDLLRQHVARDGARRPVRADLDAFFLHQGDAPSPAPSELIGALSRLSGSDDPAVTFARLAKACVPAFADACQVELGDGKEPPLWVRHPASPAGGSGQAEDRAGATPHQALVTPFRAVSRTGYPSYAGVVTHWWADRAPAEGDGVIADLMVKHAMALVDRERLLAAVAQAEDRAASLALETISGRLISMATGIVMHQRRLSQDDAEDVLRTAAAAAGSSLSAVAVSVVHFGSLASSPACDSQRLPERRMALVRSGPQGADHGQPGPSACG